MYAAHVSGQEVRKGSVLHCRLPGARHRRAVVVAVGCCQSFHRGSASDLHGCPREQVKPVHVPLQSRRWEPLPATGALSISLRAQRQACGGAASRRQRDGLQFHARVPDERGLRQPWRQPWARDLLAVAEGLSRRSWAKALGCSRWCLSCAPAGRARARACVCV